jgi:WhiB family redox-sensing transcriptional regulator
MNHSDTLPVVSAYMKHNVLYADSDINEGWQDQAACRNNDDFNFFPARGEDTKSSKQLCSSCEVSKDCLEYAMWSGENFGIWGGTSERERRKLRQQRLADGNPPNGRESYRSWDIFRELLKG